MRTTKENLIDVAIPLMATSGVYGVSLRDIAKKAQINVSSVLYHFGSKEEFISTCGEHCVEALIIEIKSIAEKTYATANDLNSILENSVENHSHQISIIIMLLVIAGTGFREVYEQHVQDFLVDVAEFDDKFILNLRSFISLFIFKKVDLKLANEKLRDSGVVELLCQRPQSTATSLA